MGASPAQALTNVYETAATENTFVVPAGVHELKFVAIGGSGGDAQDGEGGAGAKVSGRLAVTPSQTLYIEVGQNGKDLSAGGGQVYNGGAAGGGGGGGASDIRTAEYVDGLSPDPRLMVAAGGGGAGASGTEQGGDGGDAGTAGGGAFTYSGGGAGTQTEGGAGAEGCLGNLGSNGLLGSGGQGGYAGQSVGPGGGGGGGYYGGGGGAGSCEIASSGGGGGSSLVPPLALATLASASASPLVEITWYLPPTISFVAPTDGATYTQGQVVNANYSCTPGEGATMESCIGPVANGAAINTSTLGPHTFSVDAEDKSKGTTTESVSYAVVAKAETPQPTPQPQPQPQPTPPRVPETVLGSHPKKTIKTTKKKVKVKFAFSSDVSGATFNCKLDKGLFVPCTSPRTYSVKLGKHKFSVEAFNPGGTDPSPATFAFTVKKKK